eukprot:Skav200815  [mRNA]  locus=scaffold454:14124:22270:- [translate_table: standard]
MLLERGINLDYRDELKQSALFYAARQGHVGTIKYLIRKGANVNLVDRCTFEGLSAAVLSLEEALLRGDASKELDALQQAAAEAGVAGDAFVSGLLRSLPVWAPADLEVQTTKRRAE